MLLVALALPLSAAIGDELTTKPSKYAVKETVDRLTAALKEKGITPVARIDHAAAAKTAGLELKPTEVLLFGNPKLGTPLMQTNRHVAIDLPMRVLVWEDDAGKVWIGYTPPSTLKARYKLDGRDDILQTLAGALDAFTNAAAN
ncbi:MAG: DUF302 domain-containing protein [Rhodospirillales bacterium]|nr:DUF302 domain-containing protein [Rhodospirillales bacterium]